MRFHGVAELEEPKAVIDLSEDESPTNESKALESLDTLCRDGKLSRNEYRRMANIICNGDM